MTMTGTRAELLQSLVERADRARAQAMANHVSFQQTMSRVRELDLTSAGRLTQADPRPDREPDREPDAGYETRIRELQETVDGLTKRLASQGPIEQAKGIIVAQNRCSPDQAFEILRRASQRSNTKLRLLADELVARTAGATAAPGVRAAPSE
jgi:hypothetical protein